MRSLTYARAIREAFAQLLETDPRVFVIGQGLWSPWYVGSTMDNLDKEFGRDRILDSPVSEKPAVKKCTAFAPFAALSSTSCGTMRAGTLEIT